MKTRWFYLTLTLFVAPTVALAQGNPLTGFFRSITGALSGPSKPVPQTGTSTLGIRGMDDGSTAAAPTDAPAGDARLLESWAVGRTEAESAAARRGLSARAVELAGAAPAAATPGVTQ